MTTYSIYLDVRRPDGDEWQRMAKTETFTAGGARCLLGGYTVVKGSDDPDCEASEDTLAEAEWWHSPALGWELEAISNERGNRAEFAARCERFVSANFYNLEAIVVAIRESGGRWAATDGWAWYRAGMLLVHDANLSGVGYFEYEGITRAAQSLSHAAAEVGEFRAWCHDPADASEDGSVHLY